jgi:hypothetical protein
VSGADWGLLALIVFLVLVIVGYAVVGIWAWRDEKHDARSG